MGITRQGGLVEMESSFVKVQESSILVRKAKGAADTSDSLPVLLLHGMAYSSKTWVEITNTLQVLKKEGFEPYAIDLPGYGESPTPSSNIDKITFLKDVITDLGIEKPVIISPSMSGVYSIPFLMNNPDDLRGYIPVAPVIPSEYANSEKFSQVLTPTLVIYGQNDPQLNTPNKELLVSIPKSDLVVIPDAEHPCYLDDPDLFHSKVVQFLKQL